MHCSSSNRQPSRRFLFPTISKILIFPSRFLWIPMQFRYVCVGALGRVARAMLYQADMAESSGPKPWISQAIHSTFATPKHKSMGTKWVFERKGGEGNVFERYMLGQLQRATHIDEIKFDKTLASGFRIELVCCLQSLAIANILLPQGHERGPDKGDFSFYGSYMSEFVRAFAGWLFEGCCAALLVGSCGLPFSVYTTSCKCLLLELPAFRLVSLVSQVVN